MKKSQNHLDLALKKSELTPHDKAFILNEPDCVPIFDVNFFISSLGFYLF